MWIPVLGLIVGFMALVWSADKFLSGAASTAHNLGVSKILIGLTIVSIGTSAPEIFVAITASLAGNPLLGIGNAIGSNIANIGLVLGVTALVAPLPFSVRVLQAELPWLLGATLLALVLMFNLELNVVDSLILLAGLLLILYFLVSQRTPAHTEISETIQADLDELPEMTTWQGVLWLIGGLVILVASSHLLVWSASDIAHRLGVSDLVIGLTIVAVGTSLPELAATVAAAVKGHTDIAIGNVVGSNILNILAVLAVPGFVTTVQMEPVALWRDCGMMAALTLLLALFAYGINSRAVITRFEGAVMLLAWVGYNSLLVQQSVH
ncbi:MAG: calcium/sodium antiporter [Gammaproteobacteria bacterium]|nr:calcium/sodium antiporter [Gammaproteobacteria bacterium]MDE0365794.1 calcium/sodium antiporter [Gammaproteobacteria bacterium]